MLSIGDDDYRVGLTRKLTDHRTGIAAGLAAGQCPSFEVYQYNCGIIAGIDAALEIINQRKPEEADVSHPYS